MLSAGVGRVFSTGELYLTVSPVSVGVLPATTCASPQLRPTVVAL